MFNIFDNYKIIYALIPFVMPKDACYQDCSAKKAFWYSFFVSALIIVFSISLLINAITGGDAGWVYCIVIVVFLYGIWVFFKLRKCLYENSLCPECNEAFCIHRTKEKVIARNLITKRRGKESKDYYAGIKEVSFKCKHCGYEFNEDIEFEKPA